MNPSRSLLAREGHEILTAGTAQHALAQAASQYRDLAIVGALERPHDTVRVVQTVRDSDGQSLDPALAVITLAEPGELALLRCPEAGADDHVGGDPPSANGGAPARFVAPSPLLLAVPSGRGFATARSSSTCPAAHHRARAL